MSIQETKSVAKHRELNFSLAFGLVLVVWIFLLIFYRAADLASTHGVASVPLVDFNAFYISGRLVLDGHISSAYKFASLLEAQLTYAGRNDFMPWTYPPPFNLVVGALAALPMRASYLIFVGGSFSAYAIVLHRLRPEAFSYLILLGFTSTIVMIICGQNGFLTASITGLFCLLYLRSSRWAGAALGLMIIKPHLAIGIGVWLLFRGEFRLLLVSAITALALCAIATLFLGFSVWAAFLAGVAEAGVFLKLGAYPLFRMTSVYAGLRSAGLSHLPAFGAHLAFAAAAIGVIAHSALKRRDASVGLGVAVLGSLFISPYSYDYDLPLLAVGFALIWPQIIGQEQRWPAYTLVILSWIAGASGFLSHYHYVWTGESTPREISFGWPFMLALGLFALSRLRSKAQAGGQVRLA